MDTINEIKEKLNIVDIITPYVLLKKRGGTNWFGLCPFHSEKTPSFSVNEERGFFHCFGCGESGDIFTFIEKVEHTDFRGALEILAKQAGVDLQNNINFNTNFNEHKTKLIEINNIAQKFFAWVLQKHDTGKRGLEYVKKRKINERSIESYKLGYAPVGYQNLYKILLKKGFNDTEILDSGVCIKKETGKIIDKFRGRLMFPVENISGQVIGFSGRYIPIPNPKFDPPKYLNTADTLIFNKGKTLYGFNQAKDAIIKNGYVILSEGQMNIISSYQAKIENIVACMGTSLTADHLKLISRYTKNIYFCFDNDKAGYNALIRSVKLALEQDFNISVVSLKYGSDPDEEITKDETLWHRDIGSAKEVFDYFIDLQKNNYHEISDRNKILTFFTDIYKSCINPITKDNLLKKLGSTFDLSQDILEEFFEKNIITHSQSKIFNNTVNINSINQEAKSKNVEDYVLALICQNYDELQPLLDIQYAEYFLMYSTFYTEISTKNIEKLLENDQTKIDIEKFITLDLPESANIQQAFMDCIKALRINYVREKVKSLKEELSFADEDKQNAILQQINTLTHGLK